MPQLDRDPAAAGPVVTGFSGRGFKVRETVFADGLLLSPEQALDWSAPPLDALDVGALGELLALDPVPEFLLLGTGATMRHPPRAFSAAIEERGIGVEAMDSRAAARAWGLLRAEGRWIVAALLPL